MSKRKWWEPTRSFQEIEDEFDREILYHQRIENKHRLQQRVLDFQREEILAQTILKIKKNNYQYVSAQDAKRLIDELEK